MTIRVISSMATKQLLADLAAAFEVASPERVAVESVGGVDAAKRVQQGEVFDVVVLAANAIDQLIEAGRVVAGTRADLVKSGVAIAVRAGSPRPAIGSEDEVKQALLAARTIGYSTGPSGTALGKLFERWGIAVTLKERLVQAPPGVPVAALIARGEVDLGFQQLAEMMRAPGIDVIGPLPAAIQIVTTFSAGLAAASVQPEAARTLIEFMRSPATARIKMENGMEAAA